MEHKTRTKVLSWLLSLALTLGLLPALSSPALAADGDTTYTLTIPSTLSVANSGWNATAGISATGTLASDKKLTVTASSDGEFALVNQSDNTQKVSYTMKETSDGEAKTAWEFTELPGSATLGIDVADYSSMPAGTYTDSVTFTASVGAAAPLYYDKAVQVYRNDNPGYRDYVYYGNYKTLSADEGYALAQYFASVNSCSVCVITDWIDSSGQMKYVTNSSSAEQQSTPSFFGRYDRVYLVPKN